MAQALQQIFNAFPEVSMRYVHNEIVSEMSFVESAEIPGLFVLMDRDHTQIAIPGSDTCLLIKFPKRLQ